MKISSFPPKYNMQNLWGRDIKMVPYQRLQKQLQWIDVRLKSRKRLQQTVTLNDHKNNQQWDEEVWVQHSLHWGIYVDILHDESWLFGIRWVWKFNYTHYKIHIMITWKTLNHSWFNCLHYLCKLLLNH